MHIMDLKLEDEANTGAGILLGTVKALSSAVGLFSLAVGIPAWAYVLFF